MWTKIFRLIWIISNFSRVIAAISITFFPPLGWIVSLIIDAFDYPIAVISGLTYHQYQTVDKLLDIVFRIGMVLAAVVNRWNESWIFIVLFIYRSIGDFFYFKTRKQIWMLYFPNFIEFFFIAYIVYLEFFEGNTSIFALFLFLSLFTKIIQELCLHYFMVIDPVSKKLIEMHPGHARK